MTNSHSLMFTEGTRPTFGLVKKLKIIFISVINQIDAKSLFYNKFISCLHMFRAHVLIIRWSKLFYTTTGIITPIGSSLVHERATYRCDDTRGCVKQFWPPDDEHMCSKHVEAWNNLIVQQNFFASSWLITEINILRCTVSKTSKLKIMVLHISPSTFLSILKITSSQ